MAAGFDELIDFLLSEIALCGVQGAGSADFRQFIQKYFDELPKNHPALLSSRFDAAAPDGGLGRPFYEKLWNWVTNHPDIRIWYQDQKHDFSLAQFEAAEIHETGSNESLPSLDVPRPSVVGADELSRPSNPLLAMRASLRQRVRNEGHEVTQERRPPATSSSANSQKPLDITGSGRAPLQPTSNATNTLTDKASTSSGLVLPALENQQSESERYEGDSLARNTQRGPRKIPKGIRLTEPIFDVPEASTTAPRLFASQNRIWQAITGHSIDLKKVPSMEFMLLSIIAARGPEGIAQPDLVRMSGQDKRSVPHRTDELARKGYIEKKPVQEGKQRTSLCVHKKYVKEGHFLKGTCKDDVFRNGTFVLPGFVRLLYDLLKEVQVVPVRDLRTRLGVTVKNWNSRAVRGAIRRLDETGFLKRVRARRKGTTDEWLVCIKLLREPVDDDFKNLKFRRHVVADESLQHPLDEDMDGDTLMRDIEVDILNDADNDDENDADAPSRIPPQWTPERPLANLVFDVVSLGDTDGWDAGMVRDRTVGRFWKRPMESYISRLTDHWEKTQPPYLRHLSMIRDTRITRQKKFIHYVYRTYDNFQKAVDIGDVSWEGVSKEAVKKASGDKKGKVKKNTPDEATLDEWGFHTLNPKDFLHQDGMATLSECRAAINHTRRHGNQHWDNALTQEMGYVKPGKSARKPTQAFIPSGSLPKTVFMTRKEYEAKHQRGESSPLATPDVGQEGASSPVARAADSPIPPTTLSGLLAPTPRPMAGSETPLLTKEQRIALGLAPRGRLGIGVENQIREHRKKTGDPTALPPIIFKDGEPPPSLKRRGQPLLSKEERQSLGLPEKGRLGKTIENRIRKERGLAELKAKEKKPKRPPREPPLLTKQQRIERGLPAVGRLPNSVIDQLRQERATGRTAVERNADSRNIETAETIQEASAVEGVEASTETEPPLSQESSIRPAHVHTQLVNTASLNENGNSEAMPSLSASEKRKVNVIGEDVTPSLKRVCMGLDKEDNNQTTASQSAPGKRKADGTDEDMTLSPKRVCTGLGKEGNTQTTSSPSTSRKRQADDTSEVVEPSLRRIRERMDSNQNGGQIGSPSPTVQTADGSHPAFTPTGTALEESVVASIEGGPSKIPNSSTVQNRTPADFIQSQFIPVASNQESRAQLILDRYENRTDAGVYVNPFAKRKIGRGRPRNALMVTFRSTRLHDLDWFKPDPVPEGQKSMAATSTSGKVPRRQNRVRSSDTPPLQESPASEADSMSIAQTADGGKSVEGRKRTMMRDFTTVTPVTAILSPSSVADPQNTVLPPAAPDAELSVVSTDLPDSSASRSAPAGWLAINAPTQPQVTAYRSPYTPITDPDAVLSPKESINVSALIEPGKSHADVSGVSTPVTGTPAPENDRESSVTSEVRVIEPVRKESGYTRPKKRGALAARGVVLGKGNVWRMRTSIIREILDRCNGVFPMNGEISIPFFALWEQRFSKNMVKPDRSTLTNTINNMIDDPEHQMKKMSFHIPNTDGTTMIERFIVAYKHLTPASPEVKELQHNMIKWYPKKFYPEPIHDLLSDERQYQPPPLAPIDTSIDLDKLYGKRTLDDQIRAATRRREKVILEKKQRGEETRISQNKEVEKVAPKQAPGHRPKRTRLASLNKATKKSKDSTAQRINLTPNSEKDAERGHREASPAASDTSEETPLMWLRPRRSQLQTVNEMVDQNVSPTEPETEAQNTANLKDLGHGQSDSERGPLAMTLMTPMICFHATSGTFATMFWNSAGTNKSNPVAFETSATVLESNARTSARRKRVRIAETSVELTNKRPRLLRELAPKPVAEPLHIQSDDSEETSSSEDELIRAKQRRRTRKSLALPTLLERLTGLTGDQNAPIYQPPVKKRYPQIAPKPWSERKLTQKNKQSKEKRYPVVLDPMDRFKKILCVFVIASSMSLEDGSIDWTIVEKIYDADKNFDLSRTKKTWKWVQANMNAQLVELTSDFQSSFLKAYENGSVASIDDPETYDWSSLVQWALRTCKYTELPLPFDRNILQDFVVDEAGYEVLDRARWHVDKLPFHSRATQLAKYSFTIPLRSSNQLARSREETSLKARSWIRSNTATPQAMYNGKLAHDKMSVLGDTALERAVADLVENSLIRMRKIKRLLPGRNYNFTAKSARDYRQPFELSDFMASVQLKKDLDAAFAHEDPSKRTFSILRAAEDGSVMAVLTLLGEGRVKFVPRLPPINSDFDAPYPKISKWGLCEGDYVHRAIDRQRLFWPIDVIPTSTYEFGNPLQPFSDPTEVGRLDTWYSLPDPPLPGKQNPEALLPIWSSIDGKNVTWPWWYRILNLVLQALAFQPGVTAKELYQQCSAYTTEVFEIDLVLEWLETVKAASKSEIGGYRVNSGFWAAFGDKLIDIEGDWYNEHVTRKKTNHTKQRWRQNPNFQSSNRQRDQTQQASSDSEGAAESGEREVADITAQQKYLHNVHQHYQVARQTLDKASELGQHAENDPRNQFSAQEQEPSPGQESSLGQEPLPEQETPSPDQDEIMVDAEDVDAEGESDDDLCV